MKNNNQQQSRKFYVAEPNQYPMVQKHDFSLTPKERGIMNDIKKLFRLEMLNKWGNGWRKLKAAKPQKIAIA